MSDLKFESGMKVRREVLGNAHVERAEANKTSFDADFQRFITEMAWGSVWTRPNLERKTRHMITIAMMAALGKEHELAMPFIKVFPTKKGVKTSFHPMLMMSHNQNGHSVTASISS